jgi:hypothetical protein
MDSEYTPLSPGEELEQGEVARTRSPPVRLPAYAPPIVDRRREYSPEHRAPARAPYPGRGRGGDARRRDPYPPPAARAARDPTSSYHYRNFTTLRTAFMETYDRLYDLQSQAMRGRPVSASDLSKAMETAGRILACPVCFQLIDRLDVDCYVAGCSHVIHKNGACWTAGMSCPACPGFSAPPPAR